MGIHKRERITIMGAIHSENCPSVGLQMGYKLELLRSGGLRGTVPINADDRGQDLTDNPLSAN